MSDRTRNYLIFLANPALFGLGMNLMSPVTILPVFVSYLTDSNVLIGGVTAVVRLAWALPLIYGARHFEERPYKARRLVAISTIGRVVFVAYGGYLFFSSGGPATILLVLFFFALFALWGSDGFTSPAWAEMFTKIVDARARGRLIGIAGAVGGVLAGVGILIATRLMGDNPFPAGFALVFIAATIVLIISHGTLVFLKEPPSPPPEELDPSPIWRAGARIPRLLRRDPSFRSLILARLLLGFGMTSFGFFAVFATRRFDLGLEQIGLLTTVLLVTQTVATLGSGFLNDRLGPIQLASAGGLVALLAAIMAATTPSPILFIPIFICVGLSQAAFGIADITLVIDAAPLDRMPTYMATYNIGIAPLLVVAALAAGLLVDLTGFRSMFIVSGVFALAGIALMIRVSRNRPVPAPSSPAP